MRLSTVSLPLFLASASVLAHGGARHHLARHHDRLAKRGIDMMEKRQRLAVSSTLATQSASDNSDDGGTTGGTTSSLSSTAENTTRVSVPFLSDVTTESLMVVFCRERHIDSGRFHYLPSHFFHDPKHSFVFIGRSYRNHHFFLGRLIYFHVQLRGRS